MNVFDNIQVQSHIVAESSLLMATYGGAMIRDLICDKDRDNGTIVGRSAVVSNYKDIQAFTAKPAVAGEPVYLLLTPPFGYNSDRKSNQDEKYFYNAKGEVARAYELCAEDIFTVSSDAITPFYENSAVVGNYVSFNESTGKYVESASLPASGVCIAQIIEAVNYHNSVSDSIAYRLIVVAPSKVADPNAPQMHEVA